MFICKRHIVVAGIFLAGLFLLMPGGASAMGLSFNWSKGDACATRSPAFRLSAVPRGTKKLSFFMKDLQAPGYRHGGGRVTYTGPRVARGAFSYRGPCPPAGQTHNYVWTVKALDASGKVLARASASRSFRR